jgi:UDP-2,4-diacetamido-2,4,6-trideoxy-beta-L-altropyranose hydrolase
MSSLKTKIFFRTDGNSQIGFGHLVRCYALAYMLKDYFEITFFCKEIPNTIFADLSSNGFICERIENEKEFFDQLTGSTIVVLDGYHFDTNYQKRIKAKDSKLVCIDDLHDKEFVADLIINHAPGIKASVYKAQPYSEFALGLEYTLLRPKFLVQARKQRNIQKIETVLVCFGGSDSKNQTESVLQTLVEFSQFKKIIVVTGEAYHCTESFKRLIVSDSRIDCHQAINEQQMLEYMLEAELAIVPASGILYEALASGCIVVSGSNIDNQIDIYKGFSSMQLIEETENLSEPKDAILKILSSQMIIENNIFDGDSGQRLLKKFKALIE